MSAQAGSSSSEPPWGLDTIPVPDDAEAVRATLEGLPPGAGRTRPCGGHRDRGPLRRRVDVHAGDRLGQTHAEGFPSNAPAYLDLLARSGEVQLEEPETNPSAGFVYLVSTNTAQDSADAEPRETFDAAWAAAGGRGCSS